MGPSLSNSDSSESCGCYWWRATTIRVMACRIACSPSGQGALLARSRTPLISVATYSKNAKVREWSALRVGREDTPRSVNSFTIFEDHVYILSKML